MAESLQPFSCVHTPDLPDLLQELECTLALSTYQAGKVIFVSPQDDGMVQIARNFQKPMGMTIKGDQLAIATHHEVVVLANSPELARAYPKQPGKYDGLFVPRTVYCSGALDLHDMAFGDKGLWAVNTRFSCLAIIDSKYSFTPQWQPPFVSELAPEDRCHLNGMAMQDGTPVYVTGLGETDTPGGWRENKLKGGFLMHVPSREFIARGLAMPHSPRIIDNTLYFLNSATGELMTADPETGKCESINRVPGFVRGMSRYGDYLFIGISKIRQKHMFSEMPVAKEKTIAGIAIIHIPSGRIAGTLKYLNSCEEIYDVQVIPGLLRPGILNHTTQQHQLALTTPDQTFWGIIEESPAVSTGQQQDNISSQMQETENKNQDGGNWHILSPRMAKIAASTALAGFLLISEPPQDVQAGALFVEQNCPGHAFCDIPDPFLYTNDLAPAFVDIDGDNDLDLFIGEQTGSILYFENTGSSTSPVFTQQTGVNNPLDAHSGYYPTPTFVDIDNDGDSDAVIGEVSGSLRYYRNDGSANSPAFTEVTGASSPFDGVSVADNSVPAFVDLDGDGDFDLFIGASSDPSYDFGTFPDYTHTGLGLVRYFQNTGTATTPSFTEVTTACGAVTPCNPLYGYGTSSSGGFNVAPTFIDIDGDSDVDAILGHNDGTIRYLMNPGGAPLPAFTLQSGTANPFDGVDVGFRSKITFMDIDNDGASDALIGQSSDYLYFFKGSTLDSLAAPTDAGSAMYTLEDIYQRLLKGTAGTMRSGSFTEPSTGPAPTMHTLNDVMGKAPAVDDTTGALDTEVCSGRKYWSLQSGTWGLRTGTKACP